MTRVGRRGRLGNSVPRKSLSMYMELITPKHFASKQWALVRVRLAARLSYCLPALGVCEEADTRLVGQTKQAHISDDQ